MTLLLRTAPEGRERWKAACRVRGEPAPAARSLRARERRSRGRGQRARLLARCAIGALLGGASLIGCDGGGSGDAGGAAMDGGPRDAAPRFPDGTVFCSDDAICDDGIDCTRDSCGPLGTCLNLVDPPFCDDGVFCNGVEQCDPRVGCRPSDRETCNDDNVCTIDRCNEATKSCDRMPRDQDGDGDPDFFCEGGTDCDDGDPTVSGLVNEVCDDFVDNDCDLDIDEADCGRPRHDVCEDALDMTGGGFAMLTTDGAAPDYPVGCRDTARDLVVTFTLTERASLTIEVDGFFGVALSLRTECSERDTELACEAGFPGVLRRRALDPGTYFVVVAASSTGEFGLSVSFGEPLEPAPNDTCATAIDVSAGGSWSGDTVEVADDVELTCGPDDAPDLFYTFTTTEPQDVTIDATAASRANVSWALRRDCMAGPDLRCSFGSPATGTAHELPAGTYFLVVEGPSFRDVELAVDVTFGPPTPPPPGDTCDDPLPVPVDGTVTTGTLVDLQDDHEVSCGFGYRDAVYEFTLAEDSDVTVSMDTGGFSNVSLRSTCADGGAELRCASGSPARQRIRNLAAGTYYVLAESSRPVSFDLTVEATTPPSIATDVVGNESCASAFIVPAAGGLFRGDTTTMLPDLSGTSCGSSATSNDAVFQIEITERGRLIASTEGSSFDTVLHVHRGMCVDGGEIACDDDGGEGSTSIIDTTVDPGTYFVVVDGFGAASAGEYYLEVSVMR